MSEPIGVFTITRQDIVDLSQRIAECIPKSFLNNPNKPITIAVNGNYGSGKKIFSDYGRSALLGAFNYEACFPLDEDEMNSIGIDGDDATRLQCVGHVEFDEYVRADMDEQQYEVSFINMSWPSGYSAGINILDDRSKYESHIEKRVYGGLSYVHNVFGDYIESDIEIRLEMEAFTARTDDGLQHCTDVTSVIEEAFEGRTDVLNADWLRYVQVDVKNQELDKQAKLSEMLKGEFGFVSTRKIPKAVFTMFEGPQEAIKPSSFPVIKPHHHHLVNC